MRYGKKLAVSCMMKSEHCNNKEEDKWNPSSKTARDVRVCNGQDFIYLV
jgi:ubiquitin